MTSSAQLGIALLLATVGGTGCGWVGRASECRELASTVNRGVGGVEQTVRNGTGAAELRGAAEQYDAAARDLEQLDLETTQIDRFRKDYVKLYRDSAKSARKIADKADGPRYDAKSAQLELNVLVRRNESLNRRVDGYCQRL